MQTVNDFYKLRDTEDFFNFFGLEFDQKLINIKRFHMMKEYGTLIKKGLNSISDENKLLEFLKFSLKAFSITHAWLKFSFTSINSFQKFLSNIVFINC